MPRILDPGRMYAVCCVADVSAEAKDRFLEANLEFSDFDDLSLVFVDSLTATYTTESQIGENTASSPSHNSFKDKTPEECSLLLMQLRRAGSDINHENFVIFDDRTLRDDTVLIVAKERLTEGEDSEDASVRVVSEITYFMLMVYLAGSDTSVAEDYEKAQRDKEGVLRSPYIE